jgi:DNA polymerase-1
MGLPQFKDVWVPGVGPSPSDLMLIGEAPGRLETQRGEPFVGPTGQEVDHLVNRILGRGRESVYLTNFFHHPIRENKNQITEGEWEAARELLLEEIAEVNPRVVMTLGGVATEGLLRTGQDVETMNSVPHFLSHPGGVSIVVPSFHPAACFRDPSRYDWILEAFGVCRDLMEDPEACMDHMDRCYFSPPTTHIMDLADISGDLISIDTETYHNGRLYMGTLTDREGYAAYFMADDHKKIGKIRTMLAKSYATTLMQNALFDIRTLGQVGVKASNYLDTMVEAFLLQTYPLGLKELAYHVLQIKMDRYEEVVRGARDLSCIPWPRALNYALGDPDMTLSIHHALKANFYDGMEEVLLRDMRILDMLVAMMERGIVFNKARAAELEKNLILTTLTKQQEISDLIHMDFNPNSPKQVAEVLYKKLHLGRNLRIKKTVWGGSTNSTVLKTLEPEHKVARLILDWREANTLIDKYMKVLPKKVDSDGRIHTKLTVCGAKHSGRLASSSPNLMAQPTRTKEGRQLRECFEASPGYTLISHDYSQVEMRLMCHLAQDERMMDAYWRGADIHSETAMAMFRLRSIDLVDEMAHRYPAKRTGFGIVNVISPEGLQRELNAGGAGTWTLGDCQDMLKRWFEAYPGIKRYIQEVSDYTRRHRYAVDMWGRQEKLGEMRSAKEHMREGAIRKAVNQRIQSGAQGIIKEAMGNIWDQMKWAYEAELMFPILQIHDDLLFEIRDDWVDKLAPEIKHLMETAVKLSVPLKADGKGGKVWGKMEKIGRKS